MEPEDDCIVQSIECDNCKEEYTLVAYPNWQVEGQENFLFNVFAKADMVRDVQLATYSPTCPNNCDTCKKYVCENWVDIPDNDVLLGKVRAKNADEAIKFFVQQVGIHNTDNMYAEIVDEQATEIFQKPSEQ